MRANSKREDHQLRCFNLWTIGRIPFPLREEVGSVGTLAEKRVPGPWQSEDLHRPSFSFILSMDQAEVSQASLGGTW